MFEISISKVWPCGRGVALAVLLQAGKNQVKREVLDESKVQAAEDLYEHFQTAQSASKLLKLTHFKKFEDTTEALAATTAAVEGKLSKPLKKVLKTIIASEAHEKLAVADAKLGQAIKEKLDLPCVYSPAVQELMRGIRAHVNSLITGLPEKDMTAMALGLAHSLSRYKLKFSPDKVDTMIVQAISLLDDLDKELNNYIMRCREWYGWHFPEIGKVVTDHIAYAKVIKTMGYRTNAQSTDFSEFLPEEIEQELKAQAVISMGTEISEDDLINIQYLADQILEISAFREQLYDYLKNRMMAIAPNLSIIVGELVGARLVAHAGSLLNLAKHPASTVQILGAEKALFRALKTQKQTPKYGLIYHASLVANSNPKNKGKVSRMTAAKCALATRYDALADESSTALGLDHRAKLEERLRFLESGKSKGISKPTRSSYPGDSWSNKGEIKSYPQSIDNTISGPTKRKREEDPETKQEEPSLLIVDGNLQGAPKKKKVKADVDTPVKPKKAKKSSSEDVATSSPATKKVKLESPEESSSTPVQKKKKKAKAEAVGESATPTSAKKKKKKKKTEAE